MPGGPGVAFGRIRELEVSFQVFTELGALVMSGKVVFVVRSGETLEVGSAAFIGTAMVVLGAGISRGLGRCLQSWTKAASRASTVLD